LQGSDYHHYQPGWTLVGTGLAPKSKMRRTLPSLIPTPAITHHQAHAASFSPSTNSLTTGPSAHSAANSYGSSTPSDAPKTLTYDYLVMATGLQTNFGAIKGLEEALKAGVRESGVGSIYSYEGCDDVYDNGIDGFEGKKAIFTQPKGIIKCQSRVSRSVFPFSSSFSFASWS
jgi:NADPH-dependent 2,4-dienoyl-CoA reductase/sulfur reductase-like enzyme